MLKRLLSSRRQSAATRPAIPPGQRIYAIGDIHGRRDLLDILLERIDADDAARAPAQTTLIFLGDLIDRGPDSASVVERLRELGQERLNVRFIAGNHEEVMLLALDGEPQATRAFCRIGGRETILSYGLAPEMYERLDYDEIVERMRALVPATHRQFLAGFEDMIVEGDYAFVHAGVRPGVPLDQQRVGDLRWIRNSFLDHPGMLEKIIVHGHTIRPTVERHANRIGVDTGAYATGILSALCLEKSDCRTIDTR